MTIVSLTANALATTMATAQTIIYHFLFYDSNKMIVAIIYFSFFSWWRLWENLLTMREVDGGREGGCCCFCNGNDNGYADNDCNGNDNSDDWLSFASWKRWDDSGNYIFIYIIQWECKVELVGNKVMGGGRRKVGWFFVMSMVTVTAMATTAIAMIDHCSFYTSNGTIATILYYSFYIWWKCARKFVGNKGNRREEGNRGLVFYYQDGDGNGNGNGKCLR